MGSNHADTSTASTSVGSAIAEPMASAYAANIEDSIAESYLLFATRYFAFIASKVLN